MGKKRERTDPEKIFANWNKTLGLFERGEYSLAIMRAAVTMEIAANIVVRHYIASGAQVVRTARLPINTLGIAASGGSYSRQSSAHPFRDGRFCSRSLSIARQSSAIRCMSLPESISLLACSAKCKLRGVIDINFSYLGNSTVDPLYL